MNVEEYEEQLTKQEIKKDLLTEKVLTHMEQHRQQANQIFVHPNTLDQLETHLSENQLMTFRFDETLGWQREYLAQYVQEDTNLIYREQQRRTGRTTRMILAALFDLSEGYDILIVTTSEAMTNYIREKVNVLLNDMGMRDFGHRIRYTLINRDGTHYGQRGLNNTKIYYDHTCNEDIR